MTGTVPSQPLVNGSTIGGVSESSPEDGGITVVGAESSPEDGGIVGAESSPEDGGIVGAESSPEDGGIVGADSSPEDTDETDSTVVSLLSRHLLSILLTFLLSTLSTHYYSFRTLGPFSHLCFSV